ncbi:ATPase [Rhizobium leguminosarum bv. viciae]|nr:ATPase [Rhizobium leguminosarum bv. viciae]
MAGSTYNYVTFIRTTPEQLWAALTTAEFMKKFWLGAHFETEWRAGAARKLLFEDGSVADTGEILECDPPKRLVLKWRNEFMPELKAEGYSQCVMEIEAVNDTATKLTVTHSIAVENSKLINAVSGGWPRILSNLKSLIETGEVVLPPKK